MQNQFIICKFLVMVLPLLMITTAQAVTTDVACVFETTEQLFPGKDKHTHLSHNSKSSKWYFWRTNNEIEVANGERNFGEKWIRTNKQTVYYQALYHDKKFLLDFQPADLKILGKQTNWKVRSTLFPESLLKQLKSTKSSKFKQFEMVRYVGKVSGVEYLVDWLPELKLPARVEKTAFNKKVITELIDLNTINDSLYKRVSTENYQDMDYADIGDNESHPVVSQLQKNNGIGYFHQH